MNLRKISKVAIGIGTAWLMLYIVLFFITMAFHIPPFATAIETNNLPYKVPLLPTTFPFQNLILTFPLSGLGLFVFYALHLNFNQEISGKTRLRYFLGLHMLPIVSIPLYFINHIWHGGMFQFTEAKSISSLKQPKVVSNHKTTIKMHWVVITHMLEALFISISALVIFFSLQPRNTIAKQISLPAQVAPLRIIQPSDTATLLWSKNVRIDSVSIHPKLFTLEDKNIIFWNPHQNRLTALEGETGELIWETETPFVRDLEILEQDVYVSTYAVGEEWRYPNSRYALDRGACAESFYDEAALSSYDSRTGERNWGYLYPGAEAGYLTVDSGRVYLKGFHDLGRLESLTEVDANSGDILSLVCQKAQESQPSADDPPLFWEFSNCCEDQPYEIVPEYANLKRIEAERYFVVYDSYILVADNGGKTTHQLNFEGYRLDSRNMTLTMSDNVVVLYLTDSDQLIAFQLD